MDCRGIPVWHSGKAHQPAADGRLFDRGFVLHLMGAENDPFLLAIADMGVTLLLFTIGLKLAPEYPVAA